MMPGEAKDGRKPPRKPSALGLLWLRYRSWEAARLLRRSLALDDSVMRRVVTDKANGLAFRGVMGFIEKEGFMHCALCPSRSPLRKVEGSYACPRHVEAVQKRAQEVQRAAA